MREKLNDVFLAVSCLARNASISRELGTSVLTLGCLAVLDYRIHKEGQPLENEAMLAASGFLELGKIINNFHDLNILDKKNYRQFRRNLFSTPLRGAQFRSYFTRVSSLEKNRPDHI